MLSLGEAIFTKDKPLPVSVRELALPALDLSHTARRRVNTRICIYTMLILCQWIGILNSKEKRRMRHLALAVLLAGMLSGTARAGEIPSTGVVSPPPPRTLMTTGEIPTSDATTLEVPGALLTIILTLITIGR